MQRKVEYSAMDKELNPQWHWVLWFDGIFVKRFLVVDSPDEETLFRVIKALKEWYLDFKLTKIDQIEIEVINDKKSKSWRKSKSNITLWDTSTYTVDGFGDGIVLCKK